MKIKKFLDKLYETSTLSGDMTMLEFMQILPYRQIQCAHVYFEEEKKKNGKKQALKDACEKYINDAPAKLKTEQTKKEDRNDVSDFLSDMTIDNIFADPDNEPQL